MTSSDSSTLCLCSIVVVTVHYLNITAPIQSYRTRTFICDDFAQYLCFQKLNSMEFKFYRTSYDQ